MKRILITITFLILEKAEQLKKSKSPNLFVDREGYKEFIAVTEKAFREKLAKE